LEAQDVERDEDRMVVRTLRVSNNVGNCSISIQAVQRPTTNTAYASLNICAIANPNEEKLKPQASRQKERGKGLQTVSKRW
jgi:hypothetical protein